jgi:hypothetical protein
MKFKQKLKIYIPNYTNYQALLKYNTGIFRIFEDFKLFIESEAGFSKNITQ